jgi:hypothetical protein
METVTDRAGYIAAPGEVVPRLYTAGEVCEMLRCESEAWLIDRVRTGEFPARRICRSLRFSVADIQAIIAACAVTTADDIPVPTSRQRRQNPLLGVGGNVGVNR